VIVYGSLVIVVGRLFASAGAPLGVSLLKLAFGVGGGL
jgi:hypothetical protein